MKSVSLTLPSPTGAIDPPLGLNQNPLGIRLVSRLTIHPSILHVPAHFGIPLRCLHAHVVCCRLRIPIGQSGCQGVDLSLDLRRGEAQFRELDFVVVVVGQVRSFVGVAWHGGGQERPSSLMLLLMLLLLRNVGIVVNRFGNGEFFPLFLLEGSDAFGGAVRMLGGRPRLA